MRSTSCRRSRRRSSTPHESGVVHRDIKPENVLIDPRGRVRLVDFGLATLLGPGRRAGLDDRVAGTLAYMAPEQMATPAAVDHRADIYSTGVVFYEMLARELPGPDRVPPLASPSPTPASTRSSSAPWSATATAATRRRG